MERYENATEQQVYVAPEVVEVGGFAEVTLGQQGDLLEFILERTF
ncbi:lasso RiPP family leader peptide-containing protein [Embleya sp. NPDC005971]